MPFLLIVESPGKLKTLRQILGKEWILEASVGHTTELASDGRHSLGFDLLPDRIVTRYVPRGARGARVLAGLRRAVRLADRVYLATDPDREGEAIAWHLVEQLKLRDYCRVSYTQITEAAVKNAIRNPGALDFALVEAQRARQCLDKLVGYEVSPLLWNSTGGKSAGRVQSATLHLVCERERERLAFRSEDYWVLKSSYGEGLEALYEAPETDGKEPTAEPGRIRTEAAARVIERIARESPHVVASVESKDEHRNPPPPFITSSLQQAAGMRFKFSPKKTMQIAQELYEGIGGKGLITYMRTDSTELSPEFVAEVAEWLRANSPESMAIRPATHRARAGAQAAHEAIRPTTAALTPELAAAKLTPDQRKIYGLVWERSVASQCRPALLARAKTTIACAETRWVARGMTVRDPGYLKFWRNTEDEKSLPILRVDQMLAFRDVAVDRRTTEPPSRYTEPKLVQIMEKRGIGRPSTYASTIATLKEREYVALEKNFLAPTALGMATDAAVAKALPDLVDPEFTAKMESELDAIAEKKFPWERYLIEWNRDYFEPALANARRVFGEIPRAPGTTRGSRGAPPDAATEAKLAKATERARKAGALPICAKEHGELVLRMSAKGAPYWKCATPGCESIAWQAELSSEKCPECAEALSKIRSRKVTGGYFLKCARSDRHAGEVVLFRNRKTKAWERATAR